MDVPVLLEPRRVAPDIDVIPAYSPLPGLGWLAVNAFLIHADEPVLVDTGLFAVSDAFMDALSQRIDLDDLRWLWLTHTDADHIGSLRRLLAAAPQLRVVTTYLGLGKLDLIEPMPLERVYLLNPGQALDVGDRKLHALRPPTFDAPETTGLYDASTETLFAADSFGALLPTSSFDVAEAIPHDTLCDGLVRWQTIDAPWLQWLSRRTLERRLAAVSRLHPRTVLSAHLPPARGDLLDKLCGLVATSRTAAPFVGPDQEALLAMLSASPPPPPPSAAERSGAPGGA